jgi:hypothetical protein
MVRSTDANAMNPQNCPDNTGMSRTGRPYLTIARRSAPPTRSTVNPGQGIWFLSATRLPGRKSYGQAGIVLDRPISRISAAVGGAAGPAGRCSSTPRPARAPRRGLTTTAARGAKGEARQAPGEGTGGGPLHRALEGDGATIFAHAWPARRRRHRVEASIDRPLPSLEPTTRAVAGLTRRCHSLPHGHISVRYMATDEYRPHRHMDSNLFSGWRNTCGDVDQGSHSGAHSLDALACATEGTDVTN